MCTANDAPRRFYVDYDDSTNLFKAVSETDRGTVATIHASRSLIELFDWCRDKGHVHDGEPTEAAAAFVGRWLALQPAVEHIERLWSDSGERRGPIGFKLP